MNRPGLMVVGALVALLAGCDSSGGETIDPNQLDAGADGHIVRDGGGTPEDPPDGEKACPAGPCNYQTGTGCTGATPSCTPAVDGTGAVVPACAAAGTGKSGDACTVATECAAGYVCAEKACHKLCCGGDWTGCPSANEHCILGLQIKPSGKDPIPSGAMLCYEIDTCDPLEPASCTRPGSSCQIVDPTGASACIDEGTADIGEPCGPTTPCKGGSICNVGEESTCLKLCKAVEGGGEPYCDANQACVHYNDKHPAGVGECVDFQ